jgi:hypothetical protein
MLALLALTACGLFAGQPYHEIYHFKGGQDGHYPAAAMIADAEGNLYGTTTYGGSGSCEQNVQGCGTVFRLSPPAKPGGAWINSVLYRFQGGADGAFPQYAMIFDQSGNLYGATSIGGDVAGCEGGCGTVFELQRPSTPDGVWTESILYAFHGQPDAMAPNGLAFDKSGNLYGMAYSGGHCHEDRGGDHCYGVAYELAPPSTPGSPWSETVLYRFRRLINTPAGPVADASGNLYGTANGGRHGAGTVIEFAPPSSGNTVAVHPIYAFSGDTSGADPSPGLTIDQEGRIFGSSSEGGPGGAGTIFRLDPPARPGERWRAAVLYAFTGGSGGGNPNGSLVIGNEGKLYGVTRAGGRVGYGVLFQLSPPAAPGGAWTETVLYSFLGASLSDAGLTWGKNGVLCGVSATGGSFGYGVVFEIAP